MNYSPFFKQIVVQDITFNRYEEISAKKLIGVVAPDHNCGLYCKKCQKCSPFGSKYKRLNRQSYNFNIFGGDRNRYIMIQ